MLSTYLENQLLDVVIQNIFSFRAYDFYVQGSDIAAKKFSTMLTIQN